MSKEHEKPDIKEKAAKEKDLETAEDKEKQKRDIPDAPVCEPQLGDMTPAYVQWVKKYFPQDFESRYAGRLPEFPRKSSGGDVPDGHFGDDPAEVRK